MAFLQTEKLNLWINLLDALLRSFDLGNAQGIDI